MSKSRYPMAVIALHWVTAGLVLAAYLLSEGGSELKTDPPRWHFIIGLFAAVPLSGWYAMSHTGISYWLVYMRPWRCGITSSGVTGPCEA